jgi:hypothetical protein
VETLKVGTLEEHLGLCHALQSHPVPRCSCISRLHRRTSPSNPSLGQQAQTSLAHEWTMLPMKEAVNPQAWSSHWSPITESASNLFRAKVDGRAFGVVVYTILPTYLRKFDLERSISLPVSPSKTSTPATRPSTLACLITPPATPPTCHGSKTSEAME